jgi:hypothetical protein
VAGERAGVLAAHGFPRGLSRARFAGRALFTEELQFGLTNFDSFGKSVLVVIQARASPRRARGGGNPRPPSEWQHIMFPSGPPVELKKCAIQRVYALKKKRDDVPRTNLASEPRRRV